jgi:hypothetical protein
VEGGTFNADFNSLEELKIVAVLAGHMVDKQADVQRCKVRPPSPHAPHFSF